MAIADAIGIMLESTTNLNKSAASEKTESRDMSGRTGKVDYHCTKVLFCVRIDL